MPLVHLLNYNNLSYTHQQWEHEVVGDYSALFRDSLGWLVEFIMKFLQFQPEVQQKMFLIAN